MYETIKEIFSSLFFIMAFLFYHKGKMDDAMLTMLAAIFLK